MRRKIDPFDLDSEVDVVQRNSKQPVRTLVIILSLIAGLFIVINLYKHSGTLYQYVQTKLTPAAPASHWQTAKPVSGRTDGAQTGALSSKQPDQSAGKSSLTVLPGTWIWDIESNSFGSDNAQADFWWEHVNDSGRFLVPKNGAVAAVVNDAPFNEIDASFIESRPLTNKKISGADNTGALKPGTVIVFRTAEGHAGKLYVIGFRSLHDFSFPEASYLKQSWRDYVLAKPDRENYHLEVVWELYD